MKVLKILLVFVMAFSILGLPRQATAQIYSYTSGYQVQNLSDSQDASVTINYYEQQSGSNTGGDMVKEVPDTIKAGKSNNYFPIHALSGFKGSVVISSNTQLASIANLIAIDVGMASYVGFSSGSPTVYLPLLMSKHYGITTWFSVQNTGSENATVNIEYFDGNPNATPPVPNTTATTIIKPGATFVFDQGKVTFKKTIFSGKLVSRNEGNTADVPVVVVVVQEGTINKTILATGGFDGGEEFAYMPLINTNRYTYQTGVQVQNIGTQSTDVTITYTPGNINGTVVGTECWEKRTIAGGTSETFALQAFEGQLTTDPSKPNQSNCIKYQPGTTTLAPFLGAAKVTGNTTHQPLVAIVNQTTGKIASAYNSFSPSKATGKVVFPLIMDHNNGYYTAYTVQNVGVAKIHVECNFTAYTSGYGSIPAKTQTADLDPAGVMVEQNWNQFVTTPTQRYVGSGTCTAANFDPGNTTDTPKIVGIVNEVAPGAGDIFMSYEGVNVAVP